MSGIDFLEIVKKIGYLLIPILCYFLIKKLLSYILNKLNTKEEIRYIQVINILIMVFTSAFCIGFYIVVSILNILMKKTLINLESDTLYYFCASAPVLFLYIFKLARSFYLRVYDGVPKPLFEPEEYEYIEKEKKYYLIKKYETFKRTFMILSKMLSIVFGILLFIALFKGLFNYKSMILYFEVTMTIVLFMEEIIYYFSGPVYKGVEENKAKEETVSLKNEWRELDGEYEKLFPESFLVKYISKKRFALKEKLDYEGRFEVDNDIINKVSKEINKGNNVIIESSMINSFKEVVATSINLIYSSNKKILFICDSETVVKECDKWFRTLGLINEKTAIPFSFKTLSYDGQKSIPLVDKNINVFIGTPDMIINDTVAYKDIDVVFGINIDKIILSDCLNLSILSSILQSNNDRSIQYILFGNRVNSLRQIASQLFLTNNFTYNIIDNYNDKNLNVNVFRSEYEHFQDKILPGYVSYNLGQSIPLAIPAIKCGRENIEIITGDNPYIDEQESLKLGLGLLKRYLVNNVSSTLNYLNISDNENFIALKDKSIVTIDDKNNLAMEILNWKKYNIEEIYLNIVSYPYLLRDYIADNLDFFISNVEVIGCILPYQKNNARLILYKLLKQLCSGSVSEEKLLRELSEISTFSIDKNLKDQKRIIVNLFNRLTKKILNCDIYYEQYLIEDTSRYDKLNNSRYYKLIDKIKEELPDYLFKDILFIDLDQNAKTLKSVPAFEMYQNYLPEQTITLNGKAYKIENIDYRNSIVNLTYSNNNNNTIYRQCRLVDIQKFGKEIKVAPDIRVGNTIMKRGVYNADFNIVTDGYYEFADKISFEPGEFSYNSINNNMLGLTRNYKNSNIFKIEIEGNYFKDMDDDSKFRIGYTLSLLLNEIFVTLYKDINQYIIIRNVLNSDIKFGKFKREELVKLYNPIVSDDVSDGINIFIMEDTELEKGIIDSVFNSFDKVILPLLVDYLNWLKEEKTSREDVWYESKSDDYIQLYDNDRYSYLKFGSDKLHKVIDIDGTLDCLRGTLLKSLNDITNIRRNFILNREEYKREIIEEPEDDEDDNSLVVIDEEEFNNDPKNQFINLMKSYNQEGFYHRTSIDNLRTIYNEEKVYSRNILNSKGLKYNPICENDYKDSLKFNLKNFVRMYFRKDAPINIHLKNSCVLVCDYNIIYNTNVRAYMMDSFKLLSDYREIKGDDLIERKELFNKIFSNDKKLKAYMNAEYQILNELDIKYFNKIVFQNENDKEYFKTNFPNWDIEAVVDKNYFR